MLQVQPSALDFTGKDAVLNLFPYAPLLSSYNLGWDGIYVQHHRQPAWEIPESYSLHHVIVIHLAEQPTTIKRVLDGRQRIEQIVMGDIAIIPAHTQNYANWDKEGYFTLLFLEPKRVAQIAYELVDADDVEIVSHFATPDPQVYQIGLLLKSELESNGLSSRIYADSLFTALVVNLIRRYSTQKQAIPNHTGGLLNSQLRQAIEYINDHLADDLSLRAIATELHMSPYYFTRLFKQSTGLSTHQYVIRRRIEKAQQLLTQQDLPIVPVYQQVGFQSQSHFIKVFRKHTGVTPKTYHRACGNLNKTIFLKS